MAIKMVTEDLADVVDIEPKIREIIREEIALAKMQEAKEAEARTPFTRSPGRLSVDEGKIKVEQPPPAARAPGEPPDPG